MSSLSCLNRQVAFASSAYDFDTGWLQLANADLRASGKCIVVSAPTKASKAVDTLIIQHHGVHEANAYYAPKPIVTFFEQQFDKGMLVERRGFAIAKVGESGRVQSVIVLAGGRELANAKLQQAIASGIKSASPDSRRHDHFVYIAFEAHGNTIRQVGELLVTLPMCNPTC